MKASSTKTLRAFIVAVAVAFLVATLLLVPVWNHNELVTVIFWLAAGAQFARNATKKGWQSAFVTLGLNISVFFSVWSHNPLLIVLVGAVLVVHTALVFKGVFKTAK